MRSWFILGSLVFIGGWLYLIGQGYSPPTHYVDPGSILRLLANLTLTDFAIALLWTGVAQGKGRRGLVWFPLCLVLPGLSWLAVVLVPRVQPCPVEVEMGTSS